jgi:hypothetical protein
MFHNLQISEIIWFAKISLYHQHIRAQSCTYLNRHCVISTTVERHQSHAHFPGCTGADRQCSFYCYTLLYLSYYSKKSTYFFILRPTQCKLVSLTRPSINSTSQFRKCHKMACSTTSLMPHRNANFLENSFPITQSKAPFAALHQALFLFLLCCTKSNYHYLVAWFTIIYLFSIYLPHVIT